MVEMVEDILDGVFCEECGQFIGDGVGYPRKCEDCKGKDVPKKKRKQRFQVEILDGGD